MPDGNIAGFNLILGDKLVVRDDDGLYQERLPIPVMIQDHMTMDDGGILELLFDDSPPMPKTSDLWDSTISFQPGIPVTLGGTLQLLFAPDVDLASQVGRTFDLFDWTGVSPTGQFQVASPYLWDLSNLYTTGEVTLLAVPEPRGVVLACVGLIAMSSSTLRRRTA